MLKILAHYPRHLQKLLRNLLGFNGGIEQENAFNLIKKMLYSTPLLAIPNFYKAFEIKWMPQE